MYKRIIVAFLTLEARLVLKKYKPGIVAVTGTVGKTTAKDALYTALATSYFVRKSEKSFNSEIGVPLTVIGGKNAWGSPLGWARNLLRGAELILLRREYPEWLVLEVGTDRPGDIRALSAWLRPDAVLVTRLAEVPVHVEFFKSPQDVTREKRRLVEALKDEGVLFINHDDERVVELAKEHRGRVVAFGTTPEAAVSLTHERVLHRKGVKGIPEGYAMKVKVGDREYEVRFEGALGRQHAYPVLGAFALAYAMGLSLDAVAKAFEEHALAPGRMRVIEGLKKTIIIDDSYNSSPVASHEALVALGNLRPAGRRIAVLGDMLELGEYSSEEHKKLGAHAAEACDLLITVGVRARGIAEGALAAGLPETNILQYEDARRAGKELEGKLEKGDIVLVKGSQSMRMERAVKEIMAWPEKASRLLVRQEPEWLERG